MHWCGSIWSWGQRVQKSPQSRSRWDFDLGDRISLTLKWWAPPKRCSCISLLLCNKLPQNQHLKTKNISYFTVSVGQEPKHHLTGHLWLKVCHEAVGKLWDRAVVISGSDWSWRICSQACSGACWQDSKDPIPSSLPGCGSPLVPPHRLCLSCRAGVFFCRGLDNKYG